VNNATLFVADVMIGRPSFSPGYVVNPSTEILPLVVSPLTAAVTVTVTVSV